MIGQILPNDRHNYIPNDKYQIVGDGTYVVRG